MGLRRKIAGALAVVLVALGIVAVTAAPASAAGCKVYTNPSQFGYNPYWVHPGQPGSPGYAMGYTATLTTGDASSTCNDINIQYLGGTYPHSGTACDGIAGIYAIVHVQYRYGNSLWYDDSHIYVVQCFQSGLIVIGQGYGNNVMFRVMIDIGQNPMYPWPTFKLYV